MTPLKRSSRYSLVLAEIRERLYSSEIEVIGDVGVVAVSGEMDLWTASRFGRDIDEAAVRTSGGLVLDLSHVEMIDATALGVMLRAKRGLTEDGRTLVLVVSARHRRILTITGLQTTFHLAAGVAEALQQAAAPGRHSPRRLRVRSGERRVALRRRPVTPAHDQRYDQRPFASG